MVMLSGTMEMSDSNGESSNLMRFERTGFTKRKIAGSNAFPHQNYKLNVENVMVIRGDSVRSGWRLLPTHLINHLMCGMKTDLWNRSARPVVCDFITLEFPERRQKFMKHSQIHGNNITMTIDNGLWKKSPENRPVITHVQISVYSGKSLWFPVTSFFLTKHSVETTNP